MRPTLYLHVGAHKTGSTSIQHALGRNEDLLQQHGILFPKAARVHFAHRRFAFGLSGRQDPVNGDVPDAKQETAALLAEIEAEQPSKVIVSCEAMFGLKSPAISFVAETFRSFDTKVIAYIRRQDNMMLSIYNQRTKGWRNEFHKRFDQVLDNPRGHVDDYRRNLDRWSAVFGRENVDARCYELAGDVVTDFQALVGIPFPLVRPETPIHRNASISIDGIRLMSWFKWLVRNKTMRKRMRRLLRKLPLRNDVSVLMSDEDRIRILEFFKADNEYVFRTYLNSHNLYDPQALAGKGSPEASIHSAAIAAGAAARPLR